MTQPPAPAAVTVTFAGSGDAFGSGGRYQACIHLPVPVRPASRETIGSFLNRLALANSLRIPHLLALAGIRSSLRSFTPATDDTRGWSESTPERIAYLPGRPLACLAAALPLLAAGVAAPGTSSGCAAFSGPPWPRCPRFPRASDVTTSTPATSPDPEIARAHQRARAIVAQWLEAD